MKQTLVARARWGQTTLDAIASASRRVPLSADLGEGGADVWLTSPAPEGATVHVPEGGRAMRTGQDGAVEALGPGDHALVLGQRAEVTFGELVFDVGWTSAAGPLTGDRAFDADYARILGVTAVMHGVLVAAAVETPKLQDLDGGLRKHRSGPIAIELILEKPKPAAPAPKLALGARAPRPEGEHGDRSKPRNRSAPPKGVRNTGLLAMLHGSRSTAASSVFARGGLDSGLANAMSGLDGARAVDAGGLGGLGRRGLDGGGGGDVVGIGGLGVDGRIGGPGGPGGDIGLGGGGLRGPTVRPGKRIEVANTSREDIARVIRRHLARFKHCYEKELSAKPELSGKVAVQFTIAPTGKVAQATASESTIGDEAVESCVVGVMRTLDFPQPKGGGVAVVTYPFVFASAGD